jgi:hypothetical protein
MKPLFAAAAFALAGLAALGAHAEEEMVTVSPDACRALTAHQPMDDVSYKPGVDAYGKEVAPADLNASGTVNFGADHEFWLPLEIPLQDVLTIDAADSMNAIRSSNIGAGTVTVKNGQAYFNGQPLGDAQSHAIAEACAKQQQAAASR